MIQSVLYLTTDMFSKGGIMRYCRAQVQTLRDMVGSQAVTVFSVHPPRANAFEEDFRVDYTGQGVSTKERLGYSLHTLRYGLQNRPDIIWVNHISLLPLGNALSVLLGRKPTVLNVYGLEMWTDVRGIERRSVSGAAQIISDCHFTARYVAEAYEIPGERISVIWDPVDVNRFVPRETAAEILPRYGVPYRPDSCYLMTLGRVSKASQHKGYDRILDVMKTIERDDIVYLIVGDGDDRGRLEQRVQSEGLQGRVFLLGSVPEVELVDVYNAADIFVLVSDRSHGRGEGVPLTPLEAAACGKPIIVGDEDGSPEAVIPGENGFIVSPRDLGAIRQAILSLVDNPQLRKRMGQAARKRIETDFSYDVFQEKTIGVVNKLSRIKAA